MKNALVRKNKERAYSVFEVRHALMKRSKLATTTTDRQSMRLEKSLSTIPLCDNCLLNVRVNLIVTSHLTASQTGFIFFAVKFWTFKIFSARFMNE